MEAFINYHAMKLFAEISGMNAENNQRLSNGESMAYTNEDYYEVMKDYDDRLNGMIAELNQTR